MTARVWCYTVAKDEAVLMPYFVRHYGQFCERIIVYDDGSRDRTVEIALAGGADVRDYFDLGGELWQAQADLANSAWKEARGHADYVIWVDVDEILYAPDIGAYLEYCLEMGVTLPQVRGYSMIADGPPVGVGQIYEEINQGVPDPLYDKQAIFSPDLRTIGYSRGRHLHDPIGIIARGTDVQLGLLHYRYLGRDWFIDRCVRNHCRLNRLDVADYAGLEGEKYSPGWFEAQAAVNVLEALAPKEYA